MDQIKSSVNLIKTVSSERFQEEFRRCLKKAPSVGAPLKETGYSKSYFKRVRDPFPMEYDKLDKKGFHVFLGITQRTQIKKRYSGE